MPPDENEQRARDRIRMRHMLDAALRCVAFCRGQTVATLTDDVMRQDAVIRTLEVIGEAAGRVSDATQQRFPDIAWRQAREMRNRVIHGYDTVSLAIVLNTVEAHLPALVTALETAIQSLSPPAESLK